MSDWPNGLRLAADIATILTFVGSIFSFKEGRTKIAVGLGVLFVGGLALAIFSFRESTTAQATSTGKPVGPPTHPAGKTSNTTTIEWRFRAQFPWVTVRDSSNVDSQLQNRTWRYSYWIEEVITNPGNLALSLATTCFPGEHCAVPYLAAGSSSCPSTYITDEFGQLYPIRSDAAKSDGRIGFFGESFNLLPDQIDKRQITFDPLDRNARKLMLHVPCGSSTTLGIILLGPQGT